MTQFITLPEIQVLDKGYVRYIDHMGSDRRIVEAARISYHQPSKGDEQDKRLLFYLWRNKHTSPFEMCKITFNIKLPIFVMRQFVRHRMQNLNEVSARYTDLPDEFYIPTVWRKNLGQGQNKQQSEVSNELDHAYCTQVTQECCRSAYTNYKLLIQNGVARELARMVLPVNIYTEIYSTWDLKNLLHFIALREDPHAQYEIQEYGRAMKEMVRKLFPWTIEAYEKIKFPPAE